MSKADEMFDELLYNKYEYNGKIEYLSREKSQEIIFYLDIKQVLKMGSAITVLELQAINEKVKDLGWLDEN